MRRPAALRRLFLADELVTYGCGGGAYIYSRAAEVPA